MVRQELTTLAARGGWCGVREAALNISDEQTQRVCQRCLGSITAHRLRLNSLPFHWSVTGFPKRAFSEAQARYGVKGSGPMHEL
jgi:hypothetical protein